MDKNAIKKYAVQARIDLIESVARRAKKYGIEKEHTVDANADSVNGKILSDTEKKQRKALIVKIGAEGYEQVMEEMAYTWFNRFCALRFMEVNEYLPSRVRVFTDADNNFKPQILAEAIHLDLDGLDMGKVYELKESNNEEDLYRYLLITQCNALSKVLPGMFQKIEDYTELCLPDFLLREGSTIDHMIAEIKPEEWKDQIQIIGWLYQYYNTEKKDEVFAALKKNVKITKENIPAATQLFTPDWIVRYMVENSLGRLWVEGHPNEQLKSGWKYYLEEAEQEPDVEAQLAEIRKEYTALTPEKILCIDPCAGSGHILDYLFDVLMQIYTDYGYTTSEAVRSIIENNLYGLDIDDRAAQLAYFSVMMKARSYDRRFLTRRDEDGNPDIPQPHVYATVESNELNPNEIEYFTNNDPKLKKDFGVLVDELHDAKEYGSILNVSQVDFAALYARMDEVRSDISMYKESTLKTILPLIQVAEALAQKYHVVVTNPPYAGFKGLNAKLRNYLNSNYICAKGDLFTAFVLRCIEFSISEYYFALITPSTLLYNPSYEKLRGQLCDTVDIINLVELGNDAFDGGFGTAMYVGYNFNNMHCNGVYIDATNLEIKESFPLAYKNISSLKYFEEFNSCKFMYQLNADYRRIVNNSTELSAYGSPRIGLQTNDNNRFVRLWHEVDYNKFCSCHLPSDTSFDETWYPMVKGGGYRKWYGNIESVVNWKDNGKEIKTLNIGAAGGRIVAEECYFQEGLTWTHTTYSQPFSIRFMPVGVIINIEGPAIFGASDKQKWLLGCLNSCVADDVFKKVVSSIHYSASEIGSFPIIYKVNKSIDIIVDNNILLSRADWDAFETSWNFTRHPLAPSTQDKQEQENSQFVSSRMEKFGRISWHYDNWANECANRFAQLKANEEELNRIFIDIYGLQDELTPEVEDKDVTVRLADKTRDVKSLISYAVGCMFGRYSLDVDGLAFAGGEWDASKYSTYIPDKDGIIPICDDEYFEDDIANRFVDFVCVVYGKDTLEENLQFIADALGGTGSPRQIIRNYFINDFYKDHCKVYQKRPIYWLFDSGKKNGFKCLIYMHRYQSDTIARIRTDYVHEQQSRYRTAIADLEGRILGAATSERVRLNKQLSKLQAQSEELRVYEEKIHHMADQYISIDLDDGVKVNYAKFQDVLAKIK